jgi:D-alanyl-D-alanine carboxypeptidase (penicillin-binding protein 5/6)
VLCVVLCARVPWAAAVPAAAHPATAILVDALSGESLVEEDADAPRPAGSLNQLMVLLLAIEQAALGAFPLEMLVPVSGVAATAPAAGDAHARGDAVGTRAQIALDASKVYRLSDLLRAVAVSAADAAALAAAEVVAGSVPGCLALMNARALRLGMEATSYASIAGVQPGTASADTTTARDLARLARALVAQPPALQWASLGGLPFDHGAVLLRNTNQLIGTVAGADGLQASSCRGAGHSVVATAQRRALRLVAVVLGAPDSASRYRKAVDLLEWGFAHYERLEVVKKGERLNLPIRVVSGAVAQITPVAGQTLSLLSRRDEERDLQVRYQFPAVVEAPLKRHQPIGEVIVEERGELVAVIPALSPRSVASTGIMSATREIDSLNQ